MQILKNEKHKKSWLLVFAVLCFTAFFAFSLIGQQLKISEKEKDLDTLNAQLSTQQIKNEELKDSLEKEDDLANYAERVARTELDFAKPGEKVFVDVGGSD